MLINPSPDFWKGKRVLVTGHTGFKGAWLSLWLASMGAEVTGVSLEPESSPNLFSIADIASVVRSHIIDIRNQKAVDEVVLSSRPEVVFHLAAQSLVRPSYDDPVGTYATNVMGTVHLLDAVRRCRGTQVFINVTSDKCYENFEFDRPYNESDQMGGHDPYSSSKGCSELVTSAFRRSFFQEGAGGPNMALASARAGNVIGGGDWSKDRLVPDCINSLALGNSILIRNPHAIRPWQHVLEPLSGYLILAEKMYANIDGFAEAWNFGPAGEGAMPVEWVVERIVTHWGGNAKWELQPGDHPHEATFLRVDASKAHERLNWLPKLDVGTAIEWTADWYREQLSGANARQLCEKQIQRYQEMEL